MRCILFSVLALLLPYCWAQFSDWQAGQINTTLCFWLQPRVAQVRDKIYMDGGSAWWTPGLADGTYAVAHSNENFYGWVMSYDLSKPFGPDTNVTGILLDGMLSRDRGQTPLYLDGALLANDDQFFFYGGALASQSESWTVPPGSQVIEYQVYAYGPDKPLWKPGFSTRTLPGGVTRYIAYGGSASAPSENKAWYFSGLAAKDRGPINFPGEPIPSVPSNTLIEVDMKEQYHETWTNRTVPDTIQPRANPELVWVPIGEQGILVVLGGVVYPEWDNVALLRHNVTDSEKQSPVFMSTIDIYDIANDKWYKQPTQGGPGTRTRGCAVMAPAADHSSFNIYYYGGYDGLHSDEDFSDEVWVLSLPSFTWTKISEGKVSHARAGHKCFLPYPDQMMVVGGYTTHPERTQLRCLEGGPIGMFNITSGQWMDSYDPNKYGVYGVHEKLQAAIGGDASGHANLTAPPAGWASTDLGAVFSKQYEFNKITKWWPYKGASTNKTSPRQSPPPEAKSKGSSHWMPAVLGVVLGFGVLSISLFSFCMWRRCRTRRDRSNTSSSGEATSDRIFYWVKSQPQPKSPVTVTSSDGSEADLPAVPPRSARRSQNLTSTLACHEMENNPIAELGDTSSPVELHGTGLTTADAIQRHAGFTPLLTSFNSVSSFRTATTPSPGAPSSASDGTPSTPLHPSRWARKMSTISAVSLESGEGANIPSPNSLVSPIGPARTPTRDGEDGEDGNGDNDLGPGGSPLRNVVSKDDIRR